jgi:hypothetical protein
MPDGVRIAASAPQMGRIGCVVGDGGRGVPWGPDRRQPKATELVPLLGRLPRAIWGPQISSTFNLRCRRSRCFGENGHFDDPVNAIRLTPSTGAPCLWRWPRRPNTSRPPRCVRLPTLLGFQKTIRAGRMAGRDRGAYARRSRRTHHVCSDRRDEGSSACSIRWGRLKLARYR